MNVSKLLDSKNQEELKMWADKLTAWANQQPQVVLTNATTVTITFPDGSVVTATVVEQ